MVRVVAPAALRQAECSVVQQRSDAKPWLAVVAAVVYCRRCINAGTTHSCKPLQLLQADKVRRKTRVRRCANFCSATTRIGDAAPFYVISQPSRTSAGHRSRSPGSAHGR